MKKPSSKIREEIAKLQDQLKHAETREAERIGRIALKTGLGDFEIDETELQAAFEDVAKRFRGGRGSDKSGSTGKGREGASTSPALETAPVSTGTAQGSGSEA
ncbi:conjugal transfer protein TraC [Pararhizobium antarcticum]|uniref:Conjugal transfer protein TraC n=1 Tax=Pararhizobium antarcticum TaxID=1798805 RepID=A0A657LM48_9HYPH|nr:conjugal transfer protein TraC [Pararhizobium antarcticum]OJF91490.1 conjugal transfer protein TraC [Pararhizobium antarcticum]OJF99482.1 conjugal transfer protein TraC [Rhizobium sp. 58]